MSCLSVTQINCDMRLNAEVICLVYDGPQVNCNSVQIYILDVGMDWLV